jgi:hypothetical protein
MINCTPKSGGQFELESGGQFAPKLVVNLHWNRVVNLTGFSIYLLILAIRQIGLVEYLLL